MRLRRPPYRPNEPCMNFLFIEADIFAYLRSKTRPKLSLPLASKNNLLKSPQPRDELQNYNDQQPIDVLSSLNTNK